MEYDFSCALTIAGAVKCWGKRPQDYPGLTSGVTAFSSKYANCGVFGAGAVKCETDDVQGLSGVTALDGYCALTNTGAAKCWARGPPGKAWTTARVVPGLASGVRALGTGSRGAGCALMTSGVVKWWIRNGKPVDILKGLR